MVHYNTLLQNTTDIITNCYSYFVTKCDKSLLHNAIVNTKCYVYCKISVHSTLFLTKVSLCLENVLGFFFLWHNEVNLRISAYIFYQSMVAVDIKPLAFGAVLQQTNVSILGSAAALTLLLIWLLLVTNLLCIKLFGATLTHQKSNRHKR